MTIDKIDTIWNRADFAASALYREMDDLLQEMENASPEARGGFTARFVEIQKRIFEKQLSILERIASGDVAPHLRIVDKD